MRQPLATHLTMTHLRHKSSFSPHGLRSSNPARFHHWQSPGKCIAHALWKAVQKSPQLKAMLKTFRRNPGFGHSPTWTTALSWRITQSWIQRSGISCCKSRWHPQCSKMCRTCLHIQSTESPKPHNSSTCSTCWTKRHPCLSQCFVRGGCTRAESLRCPTASRCKA